MTQAAGRSSAARQPSTDGLQRDVVDDIGLDEAMNAAQRPDRSKRSERGQPPAHERQRMQREAFGLDRRGAIDNIGRNMHLEAGVACRPGHRAADATGNTSLR